jgi:ketosteroid isomerase-like protein
MKKTIICASFVLSCLFLFSQKHSTFSADRDSVADQQIKKLDFHLTDLLMRGDISTYATYLTDDYIRISPNSDVSTKEQALDGFRKVKVNGKMIPHDLHVRIYGNTAILQGILDNVGTDGKKTSDLFTKVFITRNGKWFLASLQGTSLQQ